ncbi:alpha/beta hydrolase-fold protein [Chitinophaga sp. 212800010-3]|uniref:alpha/beta hydrolase-fold protein n=1 Tax=unclassified Chitinophaga TaxID=2619133 RepID=UPI002DF48081|nr:alpha/beta hydrolase-fold protein [Chitinophaga sp. 212800010-3]
MKHILTAFFLLWGLDTAAQFEQPETFTIDSKYFNDKREIKVFLPRNYQSSPSRTYKVLYLFDAQNSTYVDYLVATSNYLSSLSSTFVSPYILVGIKARNRQFEFLPPNKTDQPYQDYSPKVKLGGADTLVAHLRNEVLPEINKRYRTNHYNIAIGHSLGATFSIYSLLHAPDIFNAVIAISPNLYYDHEQILHQMMDPKNRSQFQQKFLYIAYGDAGKLESRFYPATRQLQLFLQQHPLPGCHCEITFLPGNDHSETPLAGIHRGLIALNRQLIADENADGFYSKKDPQFVENLSTYYARQATKMGLKLPTAEDVNHIAYNLYYSQKKEEAVKVASWAVTLYPEDVNLYDSLGELLQNDGKMEDASAAYQKGLNIVEQQKSLVDSSTYHSLKNGLEKRIRQLAQIQ